MAKIAFHVPLFFILIISSVESAAGSHPSFNAISRRNIVNSELRAAVATFKSRKPHTGSGSGEGEGEGDKRTVCQTKGCGDFFPYGIDMCDVPPNICNYCDGVHCTDFPIPPPTDDPILKDDVDCLKKPCDELFPDFDICIQPPHTCSYCDGKFCTNLPTTHFPDDDIDDNDMEWE